MKNCGAKLGFSPRLADDCRDTELETSIEEGADVIGSRVWGAQTSGLSCRRMEEHWNAACSSLRKMNVFSGSAQLGARSQVGRAGCAGGWSCVRCSGKQQGASSSGGCFPTPSSQHGEGHSALIEDCVFLSVNEISCQPCHGLRLEKRLEDI